MEFDTETQLSELCMLSEISKASTSLRELVSCSQLSYTSHHLLFCDLAEAAFSPICGPVCLEVTWTDPHTQPPPITPPPHPPCFSRSKVSHEKNHGACWNSWAADNDVCFLYPQLRFYSSWSSLHFKELICVLYQTCLAINNPHE